MKRQQTFIRNVSLAILLPVALGMNSGQLAAVEVRFGNRIERVHPDEVEMVQYCQKAGIGYNLSNQTSNPGGGGIVSTDEGRVIVLYLNAKNSLTPEQLQPLSKATLLSNFNCPAWADDQVLGFFTYQGRFPKVTGLSIYGSKITNEGLAGLKNFPLVASLNLESTSITDEGCLHLSKIPTLSFLRLNVSRITDKGVSYLADLPNLSYLELKTTQITDDGLQHLGRLTKLHTLHLDGTPITGGGLKHLAPLAQLRMLSLNDTRLDDKGLAELAEHPNLARLAALYLSNTKITDQGCEAFERLSNLHVLTLDKTQVTDKGVRHLTNMPQLYNLVLSSNVTSEGRKWLAENARFAPALVSQLGKQAGRKDKPRPATPKGVDVVSPSKRDPIARGQEGKGNESISSLEASLQDESPQVRLDALRQLARRAKMRKLGPGVTAETTRQHNSLKLSEPGRQRVYAMLVDSDANLQQAACTVVLAVEDDLAAKAKALVEATLREKNVVALSAMQQALYFLAEQQPVDGKDLPALIDGFVDVLQKADNSTAQQIAMRQLGRLGGKSQSAIGELRVFQEGTDKKLAATAEQALDQINRCPITLMRAMETPVDVQRLVFTLTTYDQEAVDRATAELVGRGPGMVGPLLTAARADVDEYYPQKAAAVVAQWKQEDVLPTLRPAFNWTDTGVRLFVIRSISQMKWSELPSVVKDALEGADVKVRSYARYSLSTFAKNTSGQASGDLARLIAAELKNPGLDWSLVSNLITGLKSCCSNSSEVPSLLIEILKQDTEHGSSFACDALGEIARGKADDRKRIVDAILGMLQTSKNERLKIRCIAALSRCGAEAREALPVLREIQEKGPANLIKAATSAITSIER